MGLSGLDSALSGLRVAQQQLNVISSNVSNVNTEGYTRKILPQATVTVDGASAGVRANAIIRNVDLNLERDFWTQVSQINALDIKAKYLNKIQQFHGPPDLEVSIAAEIGGLRDIFASLADSPEDNFLQRSVVDQADLVAGKINKLATLITEMRNDAQDEIDSAVESINTMLGNIAQLNGQIKFNTASGKTTAELEDQRDGLIKRLAAEIDISFFIRGDGVLVVQTEAGVQLASEKAENLFYNRTPVGPDTYYPDPANPVANGIFVGGNPASNPVAIDITQSGLNGKLGALLELRDEILPEQQAMLDELAHKMAVRFQRQGLALFTDAAGLVPEDSTANLVGSVDLVTLAGGAPLSANGGNPSPPPNDRFTITLNAGGTSPQQRTLTIDLTDAEAAFPSPPAASWAHSIADYINAQIATLPDAFSGTSALIDANGQLNITSAYDITIDGNITNGMGDAGLAFLGLSRGTEFAAPKTNPLTPVPYVGFATQIRVNQLVVDNNRLVQQGTVATDLPVQQGSNEVIRRVIEFVFGDTEFQEAYNTDIATQVDLRSSAAGDSLQEWLGIYSQNSVTSTLDLSTYSDVQAIIDAGGEVFTPPSGPPLNDTFRLIINEPRLGISEPPLPAGTLNFDINLTAANGQPGAHAAEQIAAEINAVVAAQAVGEPSILNLDIVASVNAYGQLVIESRGNITIDQSGFPGGMDEDGLAFLGLTPATYTTTDPYIDIQIGSDPPIRVTIEPGDDESDLMAKLQGVPGLAIDTDLTDPAGTGVLILRPGDDPASPRFGGDIKITGGPFTADGTGTIPAGTASGTGIVAALFGTENPVRNVPHEISTGSGTYEAFRRDRLGPNARINTGIISSTNLIDFAQKMVNRQSAESISLEQQITDETAFHDLLQRRLLDESGVNLEEELSNMILIQTAFAAAARVVSAINDEFEELLNAVR